VPKGKYQHPERRDLFRKSWGNPDGIGTFRQWKKYALRLAIGLDEMSGGSILFQGRDIHEWNIAELRRRMGLVLQLPYLFMGSVEDNLLYGPRIHGLTVKDGDSMVSALLARVGLPGDLARRRTTDLSVGQQMRVSIGRTLAIDRKSFCWTNPPPHSILNPNATFSI
jgi:putative ABC transport system ATP-binding protein